MTADNVLRRAELLLQAKNYTGSGDWLDESGNGHDATNSGALFKAYDGTQYTYLPGTTSNYMSTADTNLLDADTAHIAQSKAGWRNQVSTDGGTITAVSDSQFGPNVLRFVCDGASATIVNSGAQAAWNKPISPSTEYTLSTWIRSVVGSNWTRPTIQWYNGASYLSSSLGSYVEAPEGEWVQGTVTATSPATATNCVLQVSYSANQPGTNPPTAGDTYDLSAVCLRTGSDPTFVPSLRIVGDLDIEAKLAMDDWTPTSTQGILGRFVTATNNKAYRWNVNATTGLVNVAWTADGSTTVAKGVAPVATLTDGSPAVVRSTLDVSTGVVDLYIDGVLQGSSSAAGATSIYPATAQLDIGAGYNSNAEIFAGDIYYVIVRDGIDGPVVARYDAADAVEPFATQTGSVDGRTWTYNRSSSGLVSTVVDRDMWLFSTDDYMVVANDAGLEFNNEDLTLLAVVRRSHTGAQHWIAGSGDEVNIVGYRIYVGSADTPTARFHDGTNSNADVASAMTSHTLTTIAGRLIDASPAGEVFVDGAGTGTPSTTAVGNLTTGASFDIGAADTDITPSSFFEGQIVAVALFREALSDNAVKAIGNALVYELADPTGLHGDALFNWLQVAEAGNFTSLEVVGALNELNGTTGVEYSQARATYLGIDTI